MSSIDAVFAYGTLQLDEVMQAVTGSSFEALPAALEGYRRNRLVDRSYPGVAPVEGAVTRGCVYRGIDAATLERLDIFESEIYDRLELTASLGGDAPQQSLQVWVYVVAPRHRHLLSHEPWEVAEFMRDHGPGFIESCRRFRAEGVG